MSGNNEHLDCQRGSLSRSDGLAILSKSNLLVALLYAFMAVLPSIISYLKYPDYPAVTVHTDDGLYLLRAVLSCSGLLPYEWPYYETAIPHSMVEVLLTRPNSIVDVLVGCSAVKLGLSLPQLALGLDFICCFISFVLISSIFRLWVPVGVAYLAAMISLSLPDLYMTDWLFPLPNATFPHLVNVNVAWRASPAFRAVYTQISYLPFLLSIYLLLRYCLTKATPGWAILAIGVMGGLLGHLYFFPWITCAAFGVGILTLKPLINRECKFNGVIRDLSIFIPGWLVGSLGSFYILKLRQTTGIVEADVLGEYWYLPVERLILASWLALVLLVYRPQRDRPFPTALFGFLIVLLSLTFPLINIQPILKQGMAPYHFALFYLNPLLAGGFFALGYVILDRYHSWRPVLKVFGFAAIAIFVQSLFAQARTAYESTDWNKDLGWVVNEIRNSPKDSVFGMNSVHDPFSPIPPRWFSLSADSTFVSGLSEHYTLQQDWMFNEIENDDDIRRELGLAWLISGRMQLMWQLPDKIDLPNDIFYQTWVYYQLRRQQKLALHGHLLADYTPCQFLRSYRVDTLVYDKRDGDVLVDPEERFLTLKAVSPAGNFKIFDFDRNLAVNKFCENAN